MKKLSIFITAFLLMLHAANAQTQKGDQSLGLSLNFNTGNNNYYYQGTAPSLTNFTSFSAIPNYSYFIANNLDIGAGVGYGHGKDTYNYISPGSPTADDNNRYSGIIYLRKYYLFNNKIGIRTGPYFSYQHSTDSYTYTPDLSNSDLNSKTNNYQAGISTDFVYYPTTKIGLALNVGSLYYNRSKLNGTQVNSNSSTVNLQFLNNNLVLSAYYVFGN